MAVSLLLLAAVVASANGRAELNNGSGEQELNETISTKSRCQMTFEIFYPAEEGEPPYPLCRSQCPGREGLWIDGVVFRRMSELKEYNLMVEMTYKNGSLQGCKMVPYEAVPDAVCSSASSLPTTEPSTEIASATERVPLTHPTGGFIIIGGNNAEAQHSSEVWGMDDLPQYPVWVHGNSVSIVNDTIYNCGGNSTNANVCWYLERGAEAWRSLSLPWNLFWHMAVVHSNEIWFFLRNRLYIFDTQEHSKEKFRGFDMPFQFSSQFCAVTNGSFTFVIAAGPKDNEIWLNRDPSKLLEWERYINLIQGREDLDCLWFDSEIFVAAGDLDRDAGRLSSVEVLDVDKRTIRMISPLSGVRDGHRMAVIHGCPAVMGGHGSRTYLDTIEIYDANSNSWKTLDYRLRDKKVSFGSAQFLI